MSGLCSFCRQETEGEEEIEKKVEEDKVNKEEKKEVNKEEKEMVRSEKVLATNMTNTNESEWGSCRSEAWQCFSSNMEVCSLNSRPSKID